MTKKDYVALAAALARVHNMYRDAHPDTSFEGDAGGAEVHHECMRAIADALAADNPRFSRERFYAACDYATTEPAR